MARQPDPPAKPFLKWAGGKSQLIDEIGRRFPFKSNDKFTYVEPFVGGGAILFWVLNKFPKIEKAVINDLNSDLVCTYQIIKSSVERLIKRLAAWEKNYHKYIDDPDGRRTCYNKMRDRFNRRSSKPLTQAALMIFLNKTGFNGLYRVNRNNGSSLSSRPPPPHPNSSLPRPAGGAKIRVNLSLSRVVTGSPQGMPRHGRLVFQNALRIAVLKSI